MEVPDAFKGAFPERKQSVEGQFRTTPKGAALDKLIEETPASQVKSAARDIAEDMADKTLYIADKLEDRNLQILAANLILRSGAYKGDALTRAEELRKRYPAAIR